MSLAGFVEACLTILLPPSCGVCGATLAARPRHGVCRSCAAGLSRNDGPRCPVCDLPGRAATCAGCGGSSFRVRAPYLYGGAVAELVQAAKFGPREELALALGRLLADDVEVRRLTSGLSGLVPVPLGQRRRRQRGYNQSSVIAAALARATAVPVRHALRRVRDTAPQSDLPLAARSANVNAAFAPRFRLAGRVALVDDVVTSGETARQAAQALLDGGASEVVVLAVARTPLV